MAEAWGVESASGGRPADTEAPARAFECDVIANCLVCDTESREQSIFLNIFQSDTALQQQLKERLEGVLSVSLEEPQWAGPQVCSGCTDTLEQIESLVVRMRASYTTTRRKHHQQATGHDQEPSDVNKSLESLGQLLVNDTKLQLHLRVSGQDASHTSKVNVETVPSDSKHKTVCLDNSTQTELLPAEEAQDEKTQEPPSMERDEEKPPVNGVCPETESPEPGSKTKKSSRKRKSTVPQRVLKEEVEEEVRSSPAEHLHRLQQYDTDTDDAADDTADDVANDADFIPEFLESVPKRRKRGRPKGTKNKPRSMPMKKAPPVKKSREKKKQGGACETCKKVFHSNYKLNRHLLSHTDQRPYKCTKCENQFKAKYHLERHMQIHSGVRPHACTDCGLSFREKHQLAEHQLVHTGEHPHACTQCEQRFQKASALKQHMYDHTGAWPFTCSVCNAGFVREAELKEHATMHTGEKPFKCDQCGDAFRLANTLKVHMRRHTGVKPYVCKLCSARFAAANTLKEHLRTHSGERKFLCHTCGAAFVHQSGLVQHTKTHLAVEDRKHVCPYCQRRFNELSLLKRHQRIHTGERPYMCSKCGKAFRRPGELSMHYRYHSNDRRHVCVTCNKSFFTRSHLKRHQATHNSPLMAGGGEEGGGAYQPRLNSLAMHSPPHQEQASVSRYATDTSLSPETVHPCMICSKQFRHVDLLTKHIAHVHTPGMSLDEQITSVAAIEDYTNAYHTEELGLPYVHPIHIMPQ